MAELGSLVDVLKKYYEPALEAHILQSSVLVMELTKTGKFRVHEDIYEEELEVPEADWSLLPHFLTGCW